MLAWGAQSYAVLLDRGCHPISDRAGGRCLCREIDTNQLFAFSQGTDISEAGTKELESEATSGDVVGDVAVEDSDEDWPTSAEGQSPPTPAARKGRRRLTPSAYQDRGCTIGGTGIG